MRHSNEVFAAFKVTSMSQRLSAQLHRPDGSLKSFDEWRQSVQGITRHYCRAWLQTEYDTAIVRAHQAANWQGFQENKDIMPNLRWMPTTSPTPESGHRVFWERKLTLPVDDPFWDKHRPGDRYNCKCSLEATDDPIVPYEDVRNLPQPQPPHKGLENNPGKDGRIFSDKHPYFPENCSVCPFYKDKPKATNWLARLFRNERKKDCHSCPYIDRAMLEAELKSKYPSDKWELTYISDKGGYVVTDKERIKEGKRNARERAVFEKEMSMSKVLADHGYKVEYLRGTERKEGQTFDILMDGIPTDLKSFSGAGSMIKQIKHALQEQGAKAVVVRLENSSDELYFKLLEARRKVTGKIYFYVEGHPDALRELLP